MKHAVLDEALAAEAALFVLDTLDPGEAAAYRAHLDAGCVVCAAEVESLRRVHSGSRFVPAQAGRRLEAWTPNSDLSPREREVLSLIAQGKSNREIADTLKITQATVKSHVGVIFVRLGVAHRTQAAIAALRQGFAHL